MNKSSIEKARAEFHGNEFGDYENPAPSPNPKPRPAPRCFATNRKNGGFSFTEAKRASMPLHQPRVRQPPLPRPYIL